MPKVKSSIWGQVWVACARGECHAQDMAKRAGFATNAISARDEALEENGVTGCVTDVHEATEDSITLTWPLLSGRSQPHVTSLKCFVFFAHGHLKHFSLSLSLYSSRVLSLFVFLFCFLFLLSFLCPSAFVCFYLLISLSFSFIHSLILSSYYLSPIRFIFTLLFLNYL